MAKARMLHKTISVSEQVSNLSIEAQLLFTWLIPHADDEGRLKGNPKHIGVMVVPCQHWTPEQIQGLLEEIGKQGLIYFWEKDGQRYIEFPSWKTFQYIAKDRFHKSQLPSYKENVDNPSTSCVQSVAKQTTQANVIKNSEEKIKKSEFKNFADKNTFKTTREILEDKYPDPLKSFHPNNDKENAVYEIWKSLESNNPKAFYTTYLPLVNQRISATQLYIFCREIKQDKTVKNPGAVFNTKVKNYCRMEEDDKS